MFPVVSVCPATVTGLHMHMHMHMHAPVQRYFSSVKRMRADASRSTSRSTSREFYAIGLGRKPPPPLPNVESGNQGLGVSGAGRSQQGV